MGDEARILGFHLCKDLCPGYLGSALNLGAHLDTGKDHLDTEQDLGVHLGMEQDLGVVHLDMEQGLGVHLDMEQIGVH